jgi:phosphatidylinositol alpha-mannosyltransferase
MASGACVIARDGSAMAEVVGETGALVETRDPQALAAAIATLLDDRGLRNTLRERARKRANLFDTERMARLTYRSYLSALGREVVGPPHRYAQA